jgi:GntR family transcriptional regulator
MPSRVPSPSPVSRHDGSTGGVQTKHGLIAQALAEDIRAGKYRVGDKLPSEPDMSVRFGVSRHTVRAALRTLDELGLVSSQQGVGTTVRARESVSRYTQAFNSAEDLLQYATNTRVQEIDRTEVTVDAAMADRFGCKPGEHWWRLRTLRSASPRGKAIAYSEVHIPLAFGPVLSDIAGSREPVFALIERRFKESIVEIQQDIACVVSLQPDEWKYLGLPAGSPGMEITRRYYGRKRRLLEVARTVHPAGVFKYSMRVQLRRNPTGNG